MANPTLAKHYARLLTLWPTDALRPNLPFTKALTYRGVAFGLKPSTEPSTTPQPTSKNPTTSYTPLDPRIELANVNALFLLLENKFSKKYPLGPEVFKPVSNPGHYEKLMEEIERAPQKSWWESKVDQWKMKVRWQ